MELLGKILEDILRKLVDFPWYYDIFILFLFLFILSFINPKVRESFRIFFFDLKSLILEIIGIKSKIDLLRLPIFSITDTYILEVEKIEFDNEDKAFLFKTILITKIEVVRELFKEFATDFIKKYKKKNRVSKANLIMQLRHVMAIYSLKSRELILDKFTERYGKSKAQELYACVYTGNCSDKPGYEFYEKESMHLIETGLDAEMYGPISDPYIIIANFFTMTTSSLSFAVTHLWEVFKDYNGNLDALLDKD